MVFSSRNLGAAVVASAMVLSTTGAFAANDSGAAALAPGKPAGVKEAQLAAPIWIWVAGVGLVALGVALVASGGNNGSSTATTTSTTP